ncbi:MAG: A24 family peptidase C-terminal domain-containing protein [Candidatus Bathyarchaeia archaeon]|jgi:preflagellin peptidase FlaK
MSASIAVSIIVLVYSSWRDYKSREVSNKVWAVYAPLALALTLPQLILYSPSDLLLYAVCFGVTSGIALLLFYAGGFGGADAKAFMCIAIALPFAPVTLIHPLIYPASPTSMLIFPITIFGNSVLFAAASGIYMIGRNIVWHKKTKTPMFSGTLAGESWGKKMVVLITGYKMNVAKVKAKWHIFPMEDLDDTTSDLKRKLVLIPKDEGRDKIVERLENAINAGKIDQYVWATPGLPMLIFVTLGLIVALFAGDLVWLFVRIIMGA